MDLAGLATLAVLLAVFVGMAATMLICSRPHPRRCAACLRRIGGHHRPGDAR